MSIPASLVFLAALLIISFLLQHSTEHGNIALSDGWSASYNGETANDLQISEIMARFDLDNAEPGVLTTSRVLKENILEEMEEPDSPTLLLDVYYLGVEVYLDDELMDTVEMDRYEAGKFLGSQYAFISLPYDYVGKTLTLRYYFDGSKAQSMIAAPVFGRFEEMYYAFIMHHAFPIFTGIFLLLFGVFFLIVSISILSLIPELVGQIATAILSLIFGVWIFGTFRITFLFMSSRYLTEITNAAFLQFLPLLYLLLMRVHPIRNKKRFRFLFIITTVASEVTLLLHLTGVVHITRLRIVYYILSVVFMLVLLQIDYLDFRDKNRDPLNILQMSGFTVGVLMAFFSMVYYVLTGLTRNEPPSTTVYTIYGIGCLLLVLTRYLIFLLLLSRAEGQRVELESLNRVANTDILTGLYNRIYCEDKLAWLDRADEQQYCLVSLDINHLKYVNDAFGHGKGDTLLIQVADSIRNAFPAEAFCCRVGGDEFIVVLQGNYDQEQLDRYLEKLDASLKKLHELNPLIPHSVAAGYAFKREFPQMNAHEIFLTADRRMYQNKREQKENEGFLPDYKRYDPGMDPAAQKSPEDPTAETTKEIGDEERQRLDSVFSTFSILLDDTSFVLRDIKHDYARWSPDAVAFFDLPGEYLMHSDQVWEAHVHPDDKDLFRQNTRALLSGHTERIDMQYRALSKEGKYVLCTSHATSIRNSEGEPTYVVTSIRNHDLQEHIDPITGLRNQSGFTDDITDNIKLRIPMCILLMDISQFGQINELYGYVHGSRVLAAVGKIMDHEAGGIGEVYRMDGARFAIVSRQYSEEEMNTLYAVLHRKLKTDFKIDDKHQSLSLNGGLLSVQQENIDATTVTSCLTYAVKESAIHNNGNLVVFRNELTDENRRTLERLHTIRDCITEDYRNFYLCYQYLVDAETESICGAEALLRWADDSGETVPPGEYIPILEQDPVFPSLGVWILRQAMTDGNRFLEKYPDFVMNVNLSYTQLEQSDFVATVCNALEETGFPADHLCLELTESCRILDLNVLRNIVGSLKTQGVLFALDDFGTGYSSLNTIRMIPFDVIKVDRQFIDHIEVDERQGETIELIRRLAENYGCTICVEGIESREVRDILLRYQVDMLQGFFYAKPERIEKLLP